MAKIDFRPILLQACLYLIEKFGPGVLDAIGDLVLALIKSLTLDEKKIVAKNAGVPDSVIAETWKVT